MVARRNGTWTNYDDGDDDDSVEEKDDSDDICDEDKAGREEHRLPAVTVSGQTMTGCLSLESDIRGICDISRIKSVPTC